MKIKKIIQIPILHELNNINMMISVFSEFATSFEDYDCKINFVYNFNDIEDGGIIFLDNSSGNYINNKDFYLKLANKCQNSIFICWYWEIRPYFIPFNKFILTGEFFIHNNANINRKKYFKLPNFVPLKLRASENPSLIGSFIRNNIRDYCYIGAEYKNNWIKSIPSHFSGLVHHSNNNNLLSYNERKQIYLSSIFALGFQSEQNIKNGHLSQRIFEGLAYGCIVLCENKLASEFTNGIVVYVSSIEDLIKKMDYYKNNPELIKEKQLLAYNWVKNFGTNRYSLSFFLQKIKDLYNYEL
jgi:hypothetical protein